MMKTQRLRLPSGLLIAIAACLVAGLLAGPLVQSLATPEQLAANVLLSALPFILIFAAIVLAFVALIVLLAGLLNDSISARLYRVVESVLIAGIVLGVLGMFQPWLFVFFKAGFFVLLVSTLGFIAWSHVAPRRLERPAELTSVSAAQIEASDL